MSRLDSTPLRAGVDGFGTDKILGRRPLLVTRNLSLRTRMQRAWILPALNRQLTIRGRRGPRGLGLGTSGHLEGGLLGSSDRDGMFARAEAIFNGRGMGVRGRDIARSKPEARQRLGHRPREH